MTRNQRVISIVGRPNVGKSTFFNRVIGYRKAITEDTPGVTRDRNYGTFEMSGRNYLLVDTGGFSSSQEDGFSKLIMRQIEASLEESDAVIFLLDGKEGLMPADRDIARMLRKVHKPVFYVINKVDSKKREDALVEFFELGADKFYSVSAEHGLGMGDLLDDMCAVIKGEEEEDEEVSGQSKMTRIALVGKPNTGKSSVANCMLGEERMIVSDIPGTTRDSVDSGILFDGKQLVLIDTAGLRKKGKIYEKVEEYSVSSAVRSIERADVVNLIIDAAEGPGHQEGSITHLIISRGKGLCIVINKWDLVEGQFTREKYREMVYERIPHASFAPVVFSSAILGTGIDDILKLDLAVYEELTRRIPTAQLNSAFAEFMTRHGISYQKGKQVKIFYASQAKALPPTFVLFSNHPRLVPDHYRKYLENSIREQFGFMGAPIRLVLKRK
ncbi:MAG TPA: ribosome biogenesis GTPase Der [Syntrophorhabdaceae bacterium]|nr:ribosome biogenesis GTPase Der [Syntrophorhabdaceae bacterium]